MSNIEEIEVVETSQKRWHWDWLWRIFLRPRQVFDQIAQTEVSTWLLPVLFLTVVSLVYVLASGPTRTQELLAKPIEPPPDFQYWDPAMQEEYMKNAQPNPSPALIYVLPAVGAVVKVWLSWVILAALVHLVLTLAGGRGSRSAEFSVAGWSLMPLAVREIVHLAAVLSAHQSIKNPGLSGFIQTETGGGAVFLASLLSFVDLYLVWQVVLLVLGAKRTSGLSTGKTLVSVLIAVILLLVLQALPGFIGAQLSGLQTGGFFLF